MNNRNKRKYDVQEKMNEEKQVREVCKYFDVQGEYQSYEVIHSGHINATYRVYFLRNGEVKDYILQKVNTYVFHDPVGVMDNISSVTEYIRAKIKAKFGTAKRNVLHYQKTKEDEYYVCMLDGSFWRCCRYIDDSVCFEKTDDLKVVEESGKAFGEFQLYLADYPVEKLCIVIPHFHNTVRRYTAFRDAIADNEAGRVQDVGQVIDDYFSVEEIATRCYRLQKEGVLPLRVTHNDTKLSNILFDADTHEHLSVIDLDTVMPGLVAFDFGDAIRTAASTCDEDEKDLSKVALNIEKFEAFTRGFVSTVKNSITQEEKDSLALGAIAMTLATNCSASAMCSAAAGIHACSIQQKEQGALPAAGTAVMPHAKLSPRVAA